MNRQLGKYNVKAVTNMLGIQAGTLRAWERRYKIITPVRNETGHRLYTEEHLTILKWLIAKVNEGFTISQAIHLLESEEGFKSVNIPNDKLDLSNHYTEQLLEALLELNEAQANEHVNRLLSLYTVDKVVMELFLNMLLRISNPSISGKISSGQKQFIYSYLRTRIGQIIHSFTVKGSELKAVTVLAPNETYELDMLIFTYFLRKKGIEVLYMGGSLEATELEFIITKTNASFLFLFCEYPANINKAFEQSKYLLSKYSINIGFGGKGFQKESIPNFEIDILGEKETDWDAWLQEKLD